MMSCKCSNCSKLVFVRLRLSFNAVNTVCMCKNGIKYQYIRRAVCAYAHAFQKRPGCALLGACALIRMNTVYGTIEPVYLTLLKYDKHQIMKKKSLQSLPNPARSRVWKAGL